MEREGRFIDELGEEGVRHGIDAGSKGACPIVPVLGLDDVQP